MVRVPLKELLNGLGVPMEIGPYETYPWSCYDDGHEQTCSAEVRMGPDGLDVEAEIQIMYDGTPPAGTPPMQQICLIRARQNSGLWSVTDLSIHGKPHPRDIYDWEGKSCRFFRAATQEMAMGVIPDFDRLIDEELHGREHAGDQQGGGGGKRPKVNSNNLMGMRKGGSF